MAELALPILMMIWGTAEMALMLRSRARPGRARQGARGSVWIVWGVISISVLAAMLAQLVGASLRFPGSAVGYLRIGVALMAVGLAFRLWAVVTLGQLFSVDVAIQEGHRIVRRGPYRRVRHPSYTGMIVAFAGLGVALGNWISLLMATLPIVAVILYRVAVEERALVDEFGDRYEQYRATTWALLPGIY